MLAENLVEPYKHGQNNSPKPILAIESKSDEERAEETPSELNACEHHITHLRICLLQAIELYPNKSPDIVAAGLESGTLDVDEDYDLNSEDASVSFSL